MLAVALLREQRQECGERCTHVTDNVEIDGGPLPISAEGMCEAMPSTGTRERWQSNRPMMRCRLPGPQLPAQTASSPVRCASAPAAKAATSSCLT